MESHHDIEQLKRLYSDAYNTALREKNYKLPTYLEDWKETLNEIEFKFYSDIKSIGVRLYPYYPEDKIIIDFANPFVKVAVIIRYKKSDNNAIQEKMDFLKTNGWTVYALESRSVTYSAKDLFRKENPNAILDFDELDHETFSNFVNQNSNLNSECLLYSIKERHFDEIDEFDELE